jgi:hypothetical protein
MNGSKPLVHCQAGCAQEAVIDALRDRDLWPQRNGDNTPEAVYTYQDEKGKPLYEIRRLPGKRFLAYLPGADRPGIGDTRRVLYHLPEVLAVSPETTVFVVEGEKDADNLAGVGLVATTAPFGAESKWLPSYSGSPRGRRVCILPDNDDPGRSHAAQVAASLAGVAAEVRVLALPDLSEKGDVSDWLAAGHTADELVRLAQEAPLWAAPDDGAALLDAVAAFIRRYVVLTPEQADTLALWAMHTHALDAASTTPYLSVSSPEKRSGKSLTLENLDLLAARAWLTGRVTAAVLVRKIDRDRPTLLLDESDAAFKSGQEYAEALRGVLNSGHRRGGVASLCVKAGGDFDLRDFATFCPKAVAGIGRHLPDTVADRAIPIVLKRRQPNETIERFRRSMAEADAKPLREALAAWAAANIEALKEARPDTPDVLDDRAADGWEPLLAIADAVGGPWPERARAAALSLSAGDSREDESLGVKLLADIRAVFEERGVDRLPSIEVCRALNALDESPWGDLKGRPLDARKLAFLLRPHTVRPSTIRVGDETVKGYTREAFADAWARYLPPRISPWAVTSVTTVTEPPSESNLEGASVTDVTDVTADRGIRVPKDGCRHLSLEQVQDRWRQAQEKYPDREWRMCPCCVGPTLAPEGEACKTCRGQD